MRPSTLLRGMARCPKSCHTASPDVFQSVSLQSGMAVCTAPPPRKRRAAPALLPAGHPLLASSGALFAERASQSALLAVFVQPPHLLALQVAGWVPLPTLSQ